MAGTHRERIVLLEKRFDVVEKGIAKIAKIDGVLEKMQRRSSGRGSHDSSSKEESGSGESSDDLRLVRSDDDDDVSRRSNER